MHSGLSNVALFSFLLLSLLSAEARHSSHHHHHHHHKGSSHISQPPEPSAEPPHYTGDDGIFDVRSFGAIGDGVADDTSAFKMAWDAACQLAGPSPSVIMVPNGYSFMIQSSIFTGPCKTALVFHVDGTIMPPDGPDSWPTANSRRQWLVFYRVDGLALQGRGLIDGRGQKWWDLPCKPHKAKAGPCDSPTALRFLMSSKVRVQGVRMKNSPQFHFRFDGCENVDVESISITAPALSPNTDGIHIENTKYVRIHNSVIGSGDDCVSIGTGSHHVDIRNLTCGPGHGISIGSLGMRNSLACVSNITVQDSTIKASSNGVRIKTWQGGSGRVSGVSFSDIRMEGVRNPIIIDQFYCLSKPCTTNATSAVSVSDVSYRNINGTYDVRSPAVHFACTHSVPCANLTVSDVDLLPASGDFVLDPFCSNAYALTQYLTVPPLFSCFLPGLPPPVSPLHTADNAFC